MADDAILLRIAQKGAHGCVRSQIIDPIWNRLRYGRLALSLSDPSGGSVVDQLIFL